MSALKAVWHKGQIVLKGYADWPEGCRLIVQEDSLPAIEFMTEAEQDGDPAAIQQWIDDLRAIPAPPGASPAEDGEWKTWEDAMRDHNLDAVRQQFENGAP